MLPMVKAISIQDFITTYQAGSVPVVDVREAQEYVEGHVRGAIFAPMSRIHQYLPQVPRGTRVFVICRSGNRSETVAELLGVHGFDVTSVDGGTLAWIRAGHPVVTGRTPDGD